MVHHMDSKIRIQFGGLMVMGHSWGLDCDLVFELRLVTIEVLKSSWNNNVES